MSEYVYLPVPENLLPDALRWLSAQLGAEGAATGAEERESGDWTATERQRAYTESSANMRSVINYLAQRPGVDVPTGTIAEEMGVDPYQFRAIAGAFGKRVWYRYRKNSWPFDSWRSDGVTYYRMSHQVAAEIAPVMGNGA